VGRQVGLAAAFPVRNKKEATMSKLFPNPVNTDAITVNQHYGLIVLAIDITLAIGAIAIVVTLGALP
jgi:hypothetical protein